MPANRKTLTKLTFPAAFKPLRPVLFSESTSTRPSSLVPNIRSLSWSPTGSSIATCTSSHIRVWNPERANVKSSTEIRNGHNGSFSGSPGGSTAVVEKVAFCPTTDNLLGSAGADGGVRLWDVRLPGGAATAGKGTQLADFKAGEPGKDPAILLTWHPNGTELLTCTKEDAIYSIDMRRMSSSLEILPPEPVITNNSYTLSGTRLSPLPNQAPCNPYYAATFSNSGHQLFLTTGEGSVKILDYPSMKLLHTLTAFSSTTYSVQQSPRGEWLAVGGQDSLITLWDTWDWHCSHMLTAHTSPVRDLSFSWDGNFLVAGSGIDAREGTPGLEIYHADLGELVMTIDTSNPVTVAAWHPMKYAIAYAGDPGGLKIIGL